MILGFDDLRNDFPCFPDFNGITDAYIQPVNIVLVMKTSSGNGCAGDQDRLKNSYRSEYPGSSDIRFNIQQNGFFDLCRIFICYCPTGDFYRGAKIIPDPQLIHFYHRSVCIIRKSGSDFPDPPDLIQYFSY